jgi:hypothetical protein
VINLAESRISKADIRRSLRATISLASRPLTIPVEEVKMPADKLLSWVGLVLALLYVTTITLA